MFKSKKEELFFAILMSITMAFGMEIYNMSINNSGIHSWMFLSAWKITGIPMMAFIVFIMEHFIASPIVFKNVNKLVNYKNDNKFFITLVTAGCTVFIMCPIMSFWATIIFKFNGFSSLICIYLETLALNFPMALLWQIFFAGPFVRKVDNLIFNHN